MKSQEIKKILDSFYEGETSPVEELLLYNYFNGSDVSEQLQIEKDIFLQLYDAEKIDVPNFLEAKLNNLIDELALEKELKKKKKNPKQITLWASVAACVAVIVSAVIHFTPSYKADYSTLVEQQYKDSENYPNEIQVADAEYLAAKDALHLLSSNFNKGMQELDEASHDLEKTNEILKKVFSKNN